MLRDEPAVMGENSIDVSPRCDLRESAPHCPAEDEGSKRPATATDRARNWVDEFAELKERIYEDTLPAFAQEIFEFFQKFEQAKSRRRDDIDLARE